MKTNAFRAGHSRKTGRIVFGSLVIDLCDWELSWPDGYAWAANCKEPG